MLYDSYKNKITKLLKIRKFILKHIIAFSTSFVITFGSLGAFLGTYGMILNDLNEKVEISYGDDLNLETKSLFNKIKFEYRNPGEEEWFDSQPIIPGEYEIRAVAKRMFGLTEYGEIQTFTINKKKIDVKASVKELPYGDSLTATPDLLVGHQLKNIKFRQLSVGKDITRVEPISESIVILDKEGQNVTQYYELNNIETEVKFVKRNIEFTTDDYSKLYDKNAIFCDKYSITSGSLAYDDYIKVEFDDSNLYKVGNIENKANFKIYSSNNVDVTNNYNITKKFGSLKILPTPLEITTENMDFVYNAEKQEHPEISNYNGLISNDKIQIKDNVSFINIGQYKNILSCNIVNEKNEDVTNCYNIKYKYGELNILKRKITFESISKNKVYDGQPLTGEEYQITRGKMPDKLIETVAFKNKITNVGNIDNYIDVIIKDINGNDVSYNFEITKKYGTLEIGKRKAIISTESSEKTFDGLALYNEGFVCENLIDDQYIVVQTHTELVNAGEVDNVLTYKIFDKDNNDITSNYTIEHDYGKLTINKKDFELKSKSIDKVYDGKNLSCGEIDSYKGNLINHKIKLEDELDSILNVGKIDNSFDYKIIDENGVDNTNNYNLNNIWGSLEIKKRTITIVTESSEKIYDAMILTNEGFSIEEGETYKLVDGQRLNVIGDYTSIEDVGCVDNKFEFNILDESDIDLTENYDFIYKWGTLKIIKRPINIKSKSAEKIYDDTELINKDFDYNVNLEKEGLLDNHIIKIDVWASLTDSKEIDNIIECSIFDEKDNNISDNYEITYEYGKLKVLPRPVILKTGSGTKIYDNLPFKVEEFELGLLDDVSGILEHHKFNKISEYKSFIDVVDAENDFDFEVKNGELDVTNNYIFDCQWGKIIIEQRPIVIETKSLQKVYDSLYMSSEGFSYTKLGEDEGLLNDHLINLESEWIKIKNAQSIENAITISLYDEIRKIDVTQNYDIINNFGTLEILPRPIKITTESIEKVYDDNFIQSSSFEYTKYANNIGLLENEVIIQNTPYIKEKNAGNYINKFLFIIKNIDEDVTANYDITLNWGNFKINPRPLTITTESIEKVYDDEFIVSNSYEYTKLGNDIGLLNNHKIKLTSKYIRVKNAGEYENSFKFEIINQDEDVTANYDTKCEWGTFKINPRPIKITTESIEKVYDDEFIQSNNFEYTKYAKDIGLLNNHEILNTSFVKVKLVGEYDNSFEFKIINKEKIDVTNNYDIKCEWGIFKINPRPITIETGSLEKEYDGNKFSLKEYKINEGTIVKGHTLSPIDEKWAMFEDAGSFDNTCEFTLIGKEKEDVINNYDITYIWGIIKINPIKIIIETGSAEKIYDDMIFECNNYTIIAGTVINGHELYVSEYPNAINAGEYDNDILFKIKDSASNDKTKNYVIDLILGKLTIYKRQVTISSNTLDVMYDGLEHEMPGLNILESGDNSGLINGHLFKETGNWKKQVDAYDGPNSVSYIIEKEGNIDVTSNYDVKEEWGNYRIVPIPIKLITNSDTKKYDGTPLSKPGFKIIYGECILDHKIEVMNPWLEVINAGQYENKNDFKVVNSNGDDLTHNYNIIPKYGYLKVEGIYLEITTESAYKIYDGKPLTCNKFKYYEKVLLPGHKIVSEISGVQTEIGISDNKGKFKVFYNEIDQTSNYEIKVYYGTLEVRDPDNRKLLEITPISVNKTYDGKPVIAENKIDFYNSSRLLSELYQKGYRYKVIVEGQRITKGVSESKITSFNLFDENGVDVTNQYRYKFKPGKIEIFGYKLEVITDSIKKLFDGEELMAPDAYTTYCEDLLSGHQIIVNVTGRITNPGTVTNTANVIVLDEFGVPVTELYEIIEDFGQLTIYLPNDNIPQNGEPMMPSPDNASDLSHHKFGTGIKDLTKLKAGDLDDQKHYVYAVSEIQDNLYLKQMSFGDYKLNSYGIPREYKNDKYDINPMYLSGLALKENGYDSYDIEFFMPNNSSPCMPYYSCDGPDFTNDFKVDFKFDKSFKYSYIPYQYSPYDDISLEGTKYEDFEKDYYEYVKSNYLQLPMTTKEGMLRIANNNHLYKDNIDIVNEVAEYIQNAAYYTFNFPTYPYDEDFALYFLEEAKRGVCQHYATAAVCMYRALGIPARYTVGFTSRTIPNEKSEINTLMGHAWVEVYIKGFGWIQVEATGSGFAGFDIYPEVEGKSKLSIKPLDIDKGYDGTPLHAVNKVELTPGIRSLINKGYSYKAVCEGEQTELGTGVSKIKSFILYNHKGIDVTDEFNITYKPGKITITIHQIILVGHSYQKYFDGVGYKATKDDVTVIGGENLDINFNVTGEIKRTGRRIMKISDVTVKDMQGNDVIKDHYVKVIYGKIQIDKIPLIINSKSASKEYDGTPLECKEYWISYGELLPNHKIKVEMNAKLYDIGKMKNEFKSIRVFDENGKDVTFAYDIQQELGQLEITK